MEVAGRTNLTFRECWVYVDDDGSIEETYDDGYIFKETQDLVELPQEYDECNEMGAPLEEGIEDIEVKGKDNKLHEANDPIKEFKDTPRDDIINDWNFENLLK